MPVAARAGGTDGGYFSRHSSVELTIRTEEVCMMLLCEQANVIYRTATLKVTAVAGENCTGNLEFEVQDDSSLSASIILNDRTVYTRIPPHDPGLH